LNQISDTQKEIKTDNIDIQEKIKDANAKYKISDSAAIKSLLKSKIVREIIEFKYQDTTIRNDFLVCDYPTDKSPEWEINVCQFQPRLEKLSTLLIIKINANSGGIRIIDNQLNTEEQLSFEDWEKLKSRNNN
jgi:hypothetical protein